jgi:hypothetical protein
MNSNFLELTEEERETYRILLIVVSVPSIPLPLVVVLQLWLRKFVRSEAGASVLRTNFSRPF